MTESKSAPSKPTDPRETNAESDHEGEDQSNSPAPFTLKEIAHETGISISAISKVLNNRDGVSPATRERVLQAVAKFGYRPKAAIAALNPAISLGTVDLLTLDQYADNNAYYGEIIDSILHQLSEDGVSAKVTILPTADVRGDGNVRLPRQKAPRSAILVGIDRPELLDSLYERGTNVVLVNGMDRRMRMSSVSPDYHFGGWLATRHLLELGHRKIVHVTHPYRESVIRRLEGFRDALESVGIDFSREKHVLDLGSPNFFSAEARDVIDRFLKESSDLPTAFFCVSDIVAIGAIQAIQAHGLSVPGDISVVGFDGLSIGAHSIPPLTTMRIDRRKLGSTAAQLLEELIKVEDAPIKRIGMGVELVVRQSCGPVRASAGAGSAAIATC